MKKYIKDGKVAVLYSPGYGAGWYTWSQNLEQIVFDPEIVKMVLEKISQEEINKYVKEKYNYDSLADELSIEWVKQGEKFIIDEYDGFESVTTLGKLEHLEA